MSIDETELVARMQAICDEFEAYGYRRVGTALRQRRVVVNHKKICRLMCERDLQPKRRRRYVATTDSDHECPIFPNRARDMNVDGANQLWVADITISPSRLGFVYLAAILDAWSRRVVGYAISRAIDPRLAVAARKLPSRRAAHRKAACIIPTAGHSTPQSSTGSSLPSAASAD